MKTHLILEVEIILRITAIKKPLFMDIDIILHITAINDPLFLEIDWGALRAEQALCA